MLVELMMRQQMLLNLEMLQQDARRTGVLGQHEVSLLEDADGAQRHVLQIAHRRGYNVQYAHYSGQSYEICKKKGKKSQLFFPLANESNNY